MTTEDADRIISEVFHKRWPNWDMDPEEIKLWRQELRRYDYQPAIDAINDFYMTVVTGRKPQAGKLSKALKAARKLSPAGARENEPIHVYTIVRASTYGDPLGHLGYNFARNAKDMPESPEELATIANRDRQRIEELKGEDMIVLQHWGQWYDSESEEDR